MATCKENCIHYSVCGIWDRKIFVDYDNSILSDFSELPNVEEYCRNYFSKQVEAEWVKMEYSDDYKCSHCTYIHCNGEELRRNPRHFLYCGHCGAKMKLKEK